MSDMNTQQGTILGVPVAVMMPYISAMIALVGLIVFALVRDGVPTADILDLLKQTVIAGLAAGTITGGVHIFTASKAPATPAAPPASTTTPPNGTSTSGGSLVSAQP